METFNDLLTLACGDGAERLVATHLRDQIVNGLRIVNGEHVEVNSAINVLRLPFLVVINDDEEGEGLKSPDWFQQIAWSITDDISTGEAVCTMGIESYFSLLHLSPAPVAIAFLASVREVVMKNPLPDEPEAFVRALERREALRQQP